MRELSGRNDGAQVQAYLATCHLKGNWPWCGAFVTWCARRAGVLTPPASAQARAWFVPARLIWQQGRLLQLQLVPQPGDVVGYRWSRRDAEDHVGILEVWGSGPTAATIEGNTSGGRLDRDGQGVFRNWRFKSQIFRVARWPKRTL